MVKLGEIMDQALLLTQTICGDAITILYGQVPVMEIESHIAHNVVGAINFLRSGCPAVQIFDGIHGDNFDDYDLQRLDEVLKQLEKPGEKFETTKAFPVIEIIRKTE